MFDKFDNPLWKYEKCFGITGFSNNPVENSYCPDGGPHGEADIYYELNLNGPRSEKIQSQLKDNQYAYKIADGSDQWITAKAIVRRYATNSIELDMIGVERGYFMVYSPEVDRVLRYSEIKRWIYESDNIGITDWYTLVVDTYDSKLYILESHW